jgi:peptide/nickel transport system ATP-binding protein
MSIDNYSIDIKKGKRALVHIDSYRIYSGEITFLFGESGIGKSLISRALYGLLDPQELDIDINSGNYEEYLNDDKTLSRRKNSFFVFQEPSSHLNPLETLKMQLNEGDLGAAADDDSLLSRLWNGADRMKIDDLLRVYPKPYRPSGGEKQRILLTMAFKKINITQSKKIAADDTLFIFDEPTGSLDNHYRNIFLDILFEKFAQRPFSALIITHDYSIISEIYNRHNELLGKIRFNELTRDEDHLTQNDFSADKYLNWLHNAPKLNPVKTRKNAATPVLRLKSGLQVFDYQLFFNIKEEKQTDLLIYPGEMVYLKAPSGTGKTTIAKIIMGLIPAKNLQLEIAGYKISEKTSAHFYKRKIWGKKAGLVFQHADEALNLKSTVTEIFKGLPIKRSKSKETLKEYFKNLFSKESADKRFLKKQTAFLSGGQKQRLNILRTVILNTDLLILDEPLNGLDFESIKVVLQMLNERLQSGTGILLISHNEEIFGKIVPQDKIFYLST